LEAEFKHRNRELPPPEISVKLSDIIEVAWQKIRQFFNPSGDNGRGAAALAKPLNHPPLTSSRDHLYLGIVNKGICCCLTCWHGGE